MRFARGLAVLALLVAVFLFVPMLQGVKLSAGEGLQGADAQTVGNRAAAQEVQKLIDRP
ncbi:MAG: hypothetical protein ACRC1J_04395 [Sandaracinobacteroides sp.]